MKSLMKTNYRKTLSMKSFFVCVGIILLMAVSFAMMDQIDFGFSMGQEMQEMTADTEAGYSFTEAITNSNTSAIALYFGIFVAMFVMSELSINSFKNIIPQGYSKTKIYMGLWCCIATLVVICLVLHAGMYSGLYLIIGHDSIDTRMIRVMQILLTLGAQGLLLIAIMSCIIAVCFVINNLGICLMIHFVFLNVLHTVLENMMMSMPDNKVVNFLLYIHPSAALESITTDLFNWNNTLHAIIIALIYIVISSIVGIFVFNKRDL